MASLGQDQIVQALSQILDPDRKTDIVTLGMITGLLIKDGHVQFAIEVDPARGPHLEPLRAAAEKAVAALPGVISVTAVLTAQRPAVAEFPPHAHHGHDHGAGGCGSKKVQPRNLVPQAKAVVAVASGKGGVGKSTTSANLALALAALGLKVGLFDADVFGPSQPRMMGITERPVGGEREDSILPVMRYGVECMSMGLLVEETDAIVWRGPMVMGAIQQLLGDVEWGALDVLVVDLPPGTGDTQLSITQNVPLAGAVIVSTPQDIALLDARRAIDMFQKVNVPLLGIVENMSTYICPKCGHEDHIFGHGGARDEATKLGVDFLGEVPLDISIRLSGDDGMPIVAAAPNGPHAAAYMAIARKVAAKVSAA